MSDRPKLQKQADITSFLESLPSHGFTATETFLRESPTASLEFWTAPFPPMVNQVFEDPQIDQTRRELLQGGIPFYRWVGARLGEELEVRQDSRGILQVDLLTFR